MCHGRRVRRKWWDLSKTVAASTIKKKTPIQLLSTSTFVLALTPTNSSLDRGRCTDGGSSALSG